MLKKDDAHEMAALLFSLAAGPHSRRRTDVRTVALGPSLPPARPVKYRATGDPLEALTARKQSSSANCRRCARLGFTEPSARMAEALTPSLESHVLAEMWPQALLACDYSHSSRHWKPTWEYRVKWLWSEELATVERVEGLTDRSPQPSLTDRLKSDRA